MKKREKSRANVLTLVFDFVSMSAGIFCLAARNYELRAADIMLVEERTNFEDIGSRLCWSLLSAKDEHCSLLSI